MFSVGTTTALSLIELWALMRSPLRKLLYRYTGCWIEAEDLVQVTGTRLPRVAAPDPDKGQAYIWVTARSVGVDWCRMQKRRLPTLPIDDSDAYAVVDERVGPESALAYEKLLSDLLAELTPAQRRVFELQHEGYTHKEIAASLGCALSTVQSHLKEARERLCERLSKGDKHGH